MQKKLKSQESNTIIVLAAPIQLAALCGPHTPHTPRHWCRHTFSRPPHSMLSLLNTGSSLHRGGTSQRNREDLTRGTERRTGNKLDFRQTGDAPPKQSFQKYRKLG